MKLVRAALFSALTFCVLVAEVAAQSITTTFASNGAVPAGGCMLFDAHLTCDLTIESLDVNTSAPLGSSVTVEVWTTPGTYVGNENDVGVWTKVATGTGSSQGLDQPTPIDTTDFVLPAGSHGLNIVYTDAFGRRTSGNGSNQQYSNAEITLELGAVMLTCYNGGVFAPRVWNGTLYYSPTSNGGQTYCTAKVNSCGTSPAISSTGVPSATASSGFVVECANTRGQKPGLLLYTDAGPAAVPFQGGLLCLNAPLRRALPVSDTAGTPTLCDGELGIDMNSFAQGLLGGTPAAFLQQPGTPVHAQWWARDTAAAGSLLSDGLEYSVCP